MVIAYRSHGDRIVDRCGSPDDLQFAYFPRRSHVSPLNLIGIYMTASTLSPLLLY
jgi:hypothetical protein